jgi:hypothetical protein
MKLLEALRSLSAYRDDPKPIPPRSTRRLLVVVISLLMAASAVLTAAVSTNFALFTVILVGPAYLWFARSATRNMTFTRSVAALGEQRREQLAQAQRGAFTLISAVMLVLGLVTADLVANFHVEFAPVAFATLAWLLFLAGVYLFPWVPVAILAWRLPDEDQVPAGNQAPAA